MTKLRVNKCKLPSDPGLQQMISNYHPKDQDEKMKRYYVSFVEIETHITGCADVIASIVRFLR